jgi:putative ABC transport system ATP-binding protein
MLTAVDVSVGFGDNVVLTNVCMSVGTGQVVAVVGPSGSGKSSLLLTLCGLLQPRSGVVSLDGAPLSSAPARVRDRVRRTRFGFVFQFGDLVPELTLLENVCLPLRLLGVKRRDAIPEAEAQMHALGIGHLADKSVTAVSGGELQRAAICRALVHRPSVLLADEPTGALDEQNSALVFEQFLHHARSAEAAVVMVTHESALARQADRVLSIESGRLGSEQC